MFPNHQHCFSSIRLLIFSRLIASMFHNRFYGHSRNFLSTKSMQSLPTKNQWNWSYPEFIMAFRWLFFPTRGILLVTNNLRMQDLQTDSIICQNLKFRHFSKIPHMSLHLNNTISQNHFWAHEEYILNTYFHLHIPRWQTSLHLSNFHLYCQWSFPDVFLIRFLVQFQILILSQDYFLSLIFLYYHFLTIGFIQ